MRVTFLVFLGVSCIPDIYSTTIKEHQHDHGMHSEEPDAINEDDDDSPKVSIIPERHHLSHEVSSKPVVKSIDEEESDSTEPDSDFTETDPNGLSAKKDGHVSVTSHPVDTALLEPVAGSHDEGDSDSTDTDPEGLSAKKEEHVGDTSHPVDTALVEPVVATHEDGDNKEDEEVDTLGDNDTIEEDADNGTTPNESISDLTSDSVPLSKKDEETNSVHEPTNTEDMSVSPVVAENALALSNMLSQLYGDTLDTYASDAVEETKRDSLTVDCTAFSEDSDFKVNIVTTLCPFLRSDGPCGPLRHPSYEAEDEKLFCSKECLPHIDSVMKAVSHRNRMKDIHDASVFRAVSMSIVSQFCVSCRSGCYLPV